MNYIWDVLLRAESQEIDKSSIRFIMGETFSPYMEVNFEDINTRFISEEKIVEVNPYCRFYSIFKDIFHPDFRDGQDIRHVLFDILLHYLAHIDLKQGLTKDEYYKKFIMRDIEQGIFGYHIKDYFEDFSKEEQRTIVAAIKQLYTTSVSIHIFRKVMKAIFQMSYVYQNKDHNSEVLIYVGAKKNEVNQNKLKMIIELFLPLHVETITYWEKHFCILEVVETSKFNEIALY